MRILTFLHSFEPGGVERVALRLVRHWRAAGVDAPLFLGRTDGAMRQEPDLKLDGHVPRPLPISTARCETLWMIATLPFTIRRLRPDALFCAGNCYAVVAVAMKLLLGRACPPIVAKISNDLERREMAWPARIAYRAWLRVQGRCIDHFVAMAPGLEQEIVRLIRPASGAVSIIPDPALSLDQIARLRAARRAGDGKGRLFVAIGRLVAQKNYTLMLHAFAQGSRADDRLHIYGEGPARSHIITLSQQLGIDARVTLMGYVADPATCIGDADVFLLASDYEGVPAVLLEALAVGLPVIATQCSAAMPELLQNGVLGQLVTSRNTVHLAVAISQADTLSQNADASLEQARRFTLERAAPAYLRAFAATRRTPLPFPSTTPSLT